VRRTLSRSDCIPGPRVSVGGCRTETLERTQTLGSRLVRLVERGKIGAWIGVGSSGWALWTFG
jgi:hypothetical protein